MAGGASNYTESNFLNWLKGTAYPTAPADFYVALYTANPTDAGGGTEISGNGYARQAIAASTGWSAVSGTGPEQISNAASVVFTASGGNWGTVTAFAIMDALTAGNQIGWATFATAPVINNGDTGTFAIGALVVSID